MKKCGTIPFYVVRDIILAATLWATLAVVLKHTPSWLTSSGGGLVPWRLTALLVVVLFLVWLLITAAAKRWAGTLAYRSCTVAASS